MPRIYSVYFVNFFYPPDPINYFYSYFACALYLHLKVLEDLAGNTSFCKHSFHKVINLLKKKN